MTNLPKKHPAETAGPLALALAYLLGQLFGWSDETILYLAIVLSFLPAVVTWIVNLVRDQKDLAEARDRRSGTTLHKR